MNIIANSYTFASTQFNINNGTGCASLKSVPRKTWYGQEGKGVWGLREPDKVPSPQK